MRQADHLEGQLMDEMEDRETDVNPWGILNRLSPLLFAWVSNQLIMLNDWSGRIQGTEEWKPVTQQRGCARCPALPPIACALPLVFAPSACNVTLSKSMFIHCSMISLCWACAAKRPGLVDRVRTDPLRAATERCKSYAPRCCEL